MENITLTNLNKILEQRTVSSSSFRCAAGWFFIALATGDSISAIIGIPLLSSVIASSFLRLAIRFNPTIMESSLPRCALLILAVCELSLITTACVLLLRSRWAFFVRDLASKEYRLFKCHGYRLFDHRIFDLLRYECLICVLIGVFIVVQTATSWVVACTVLPFAATVIIVGRFSLSSLFHDRASVAGALIAILLLICLFFAVPHSEEPLSAFSIAKFYHNSFLLPLSLLILGTILPFVYTVMPSLRETEPVRVLIDPQAPPLYEFPNLSQISITRTRLRIDSEGHVMLLFRVMGDRLVVADHRAQDLIITEEQYILVNHAAIEREVEQSRDRVLSIVSSDGNFEFSNFIVRAIPAVDDLGEKEGWERQEFDRVISNLLGKANLRDLICALLQHALDEALGTVAKARRPREHLEAFQRLLTDSERLLNDAPRRGELDRTEFQAIIGKREALKCQLRTSREQLDSLNKNWNSYRSFRDDASAAMSAAFEEALCKYCERTVSPFDKPHGGLDLVALKNGILTILHLIGLTIVGGRVQFSGDSAECERMIHTFEARARRLLQETDERFEELWRSDSRMRIEEGESVLPEARRVDSRAVDGPPADRQQRRSPLPKRNAPEV